MTVVMEINAGMYDWGWGAVCTVPGSMAIVLLVNIMEEIIYSQLYIDKNRKQKKKKRSIGYLKSTVNSQETLNWLFTVNCD